MTGHVLYENGDLRDGFADTETIPVERAEECPPQSDEPRVVVSNVRPTPV